MYWFRKEKTESAGSAEISPMFIIAGLGNPILKKADKLAFENTRHNVGFAVIDMLAKKYSINVSDYKHRALCGTGIIEGRKALLVKPQTFMNLSGESIGGILNYYKCDPTKQLIVIYDDISLMPGRIRIRKKGSAGGHNGMKSMIAHTGTQEFLRIKVGVGEKPEGWDLADYVLSRFSKGERVLVEEAQADAADAAAMMLRGEVEHAMNQYN